MRLVDAKHGGEPQGFRAHSTWAKSDSSHLLLFAYHILANHPYMDCDKCPATTRHGYQFTSASALSLSSSQQITAVYLVQPRKRSTVNKKTSLFNPDQAKSPKPRILMLVDPTSSRSISKSGVWTCAHMTFSSRCAF